MLGFLVVFGFAIRVRAAHLELTGGDRHQDHADAVDNRIAQCKLSGSQLSPVGLYNCPAHRGVAKARIADADAYADADAARQTASNLTVLMDRFDASRECREVTCLYNGTNWWLEKMIQDPREDVEIEPGDERLDFFL